MKLKEIELTENNHFIAMEYYFLILNRTFLILKLDDFLVGIQANGMVSVEGGGDIITHFVTSKMAIDNDL